MQTRARPPTSRSRDASSQDHDQCREPGATQPTLDFPSRSTLGRHSWRHTKNTMPIAVLLNSGDLRGRQSTPYYCMDDGNHIDFFEHTLAESCGIGTSTTRESYRGTQEQEEGRSQEQGDQQTAQVISCGCGHRRLGRRGVRLGTDWVKNRTWMIGHLRAQQWLYSNEIEAYKP